MSNWIGYAVSANCGETLGCYQGTILETDGSTLTLTKAFRNGFPYPKSQVTLNATDIKELRIIEVKSQRAETHSTVGAPRRARATVCETLQANPTNTGNQPVSTKVNPSHKTLDTGNQPASTNVNPSHKTSNPNHGQRAPPAGVGSGAGAARSKPMDILNSRKNNNNHSGSHGSGSTPTRRGGGGAWGGRGEAGGGGARRRNEACFGAAAEPALLDDFDFQGNLALFDKTAVWASLRNSKPDLVRTTDESRYRHDENILGGGGGAGGGAEGRIVVPDELRGPVDYVTDEGVAVPSVCPAVRRQLWERLQRLGLADFSLAMVARAACDVALRLVGGARRLEARNAHQAPLVVCLAGAHRGGACGLAAARLLRSRGARVAVHVAGGGEAGGEAVRRELAALALDGAPPPAPAPRLLPAAPDLLLLALYDPLADNDLLQYEEVCAWARASRAGAVCVEPAGGGWGAVGARASVVGVAAPALAPALGRLHLADGAVPAALYAALGLTYRLPWGGAPALPLHPAL